MVEIEICRVYRVAQNKLSHWTNCNFSATRGVYIIKISGGTFYSDPPCISVPLVPVPRNNEACVNEDGAIITRAL